MATLDYETTPRGLADGKEALARWIANAVRDPNYSDSLVFGVFPNLRVERRQKQLTEVQVIERALTKAPAKRVGFVTGDREDIKVGDIWVNSENTNMQMDTYYGKSTSATIRYLGARRSETGKIEEDIIGNELKAKMGATMEVDAGTVLVTGPGALERNNVRWIFHVASVIGQPLEGYRTVARIDQCVKNVLRSAKDVRFKQEGGTSILFPIFGTGQGGGDLADQTQVCLNAAVEHLAEHRHARLRRLLLRLGRAGSRDLPRRREQPSRAGEARAMSKTFQLEIREPGRADVFLAAPTRAGRDVPWAVVERLNRAGTPRAGRSAPRAPGRRAAWPNPARLRGRRV